MSKVFRSLKAGNILFVATLSLLAAVVLISVVGWPGIPAVSKILYVFFFGVPVGALVFLQNSEQLRPSRPLQSIFLGGLLGILAIFYVLLVSRHFQDLYPIDPLSQLLEGGANEDSAFHIALIRSIMQVGYPSVGLDGHVPLGVYHVLGHYLDAGLFILLGIDPVAGFGFAFFVKSAALVLLMANFADGFFRRAPVSVRFFALLLVMPTLGLSWFWLETYPQWVGAMLVFAFARPVSSFLIDGLLSPGGLAGVFVLFVSLAFSKTSLGVIFLAFVLLSVATRKGGVIWGMVLTVVSAPIVYILTATGRPGSTSGTFHWNPEGLGLLLREPTIESVQLFIFLVASIFVFRFARVGLWRLVPFFLVGGIPFAVTLLVPSGRADLTNFSFSALAVSVVFVPLLLERLGSFRRQHLNVNVLPLALVGLVLGHNGFFVPDSLNLFNPRLDNHERALVQLREIVEGDYRLLANPSDGSELLAQKILGTHSSRLALPPLPSLSNSGELLVHRWVFDSNATDLLDLTPVRAGHDVNYSPIVLYAFSGVTLIEGYKEIQTKGYGLAAYGDESKQLCASSFSKLWSGAGVALVRTAAGHHMDIEPGCRIQVR